MSDAQQTYKIRNHSGDQIEIKLEMSDYDRAASLGMTLSQYLNVKHNKDTDINTQGDVFAQMMLSSGLYTQADNRYGIRPPRVSDIYTGNLRPTEHMISPLNLEIAGIVRNDGSDRSLAGRMLFPEVVMRTIESELREGHDDLIGGWNRLIATTETVNVPRFEQPIINVKAPEAGRHSPIAQLQEPNVMVSITTSSVSRTIPTKSIGLVISDEAQRNTSLDLINIIMTAQARGERVAMVLSDINAIVEGDVDRGETAKATVPVTTFDSTIAAANTLTHKAYIKYLHKNRRKMVTGDLLMSLDNALAFNQRSGKPTQNTIFVRDSEQFDNSFTVENLVGTEPRILVLDDGVISANKIVGLDRRFALRRVINVAATYSAMEEFVLRRGKAFRFDFGEVTHTLFSDAYNCMTLTTS